MNRAIFNFGWISKPVMLWGLILLIQFLKLSVNRLRKKIVASEQFIGSEKELTIIMAILSNYTPECLVETSVQCPIENLAYPGLAMSALEFAEKMRMAVRISEIDVNRATTHNKGIFNGIDALILATGNDFRAIEACGHTFAARDGQYRGLSKVNLDQDNFTFSLKIPLSLGTGWWADDPPSFGQNFP